MQKLFVLLVERKVAPFVSFLSRLERPGERAVEHPGLAIRGEEAAILPVRLIRSSAGPDSRPRLHLRNRTMTGICIASPSFSKIQ